jgi:hypothetical protein
MWPWILAALAGMAFMYAAGRFDWLRFERRKVEAAAEARYRHDIQALTRQLTDDERELAWRREVDHAQARDPRGWDNGAGYRSTRSPDLSSQPSKEARHASVR